MKQSTPELRELRNSITRLVTDMTVEKKLSEEILIDRLIELFTQHEAAIRVDELKSLAIMWGALEDPRQAVIDRIAQLQHPQSDKEQSV